MPIFGRKNPSIDFKARLERKLCLARETPEPVFDLSDCGLKAVPSGIYALCKVFRKEALYLQVNHLTSLTGGGQISDLALLLILDVHSNNLSKLPDDIIILKNLRELNVSANKLTSLPENIGEMCKLRILNVSNNNLKCLPKSLGSLHELQSLDIQMNKNLTKLPSSLYTAKCLEVILLDSGNFVYPACDVTDKGTQAIMKFLCAENGEEYFAPEHTLHSLSENVECEWFKFEEEEKQFKAKVLQLETLKMQKQQERLALEKEILEQQQKELELQNSMKNSKIKLMEDLVKQQNQLENEITRVHQNHELDRLRLINQIQEVEETTNNIVSQLLAASDSKDLSQIQSLWEQESSEQKCLLESCHEKFQSLRRKDVLSAMESLLKEELQREEKIHKYEKEKAESVRRTLMNQGMENDKALSELLVIRNQDRYNLTSQLQQNEELQRAAVRTLLERGDARSWGLTQQLRLVQDQLAALTAVEMKRRQLQISEQVEELNHKRMALSEILVGLLAQQNSRRKQLLMTLDELERSNVEGQKQRNNDFWLVQYQRLLDSRGTVFADLERSLDPALARNLLEVGVIHCLPFLSQWVLIPDQLSRVSDNDLRQVGISSSETRGMILKAFKLYLEEREERKQEIPEAASAPYESLEEEVPSEQVNSLGTGECVVCLDNNCQIIFIPCGHLCCCLKCSEPLDDCPMCRTNIDQKIRVICS